MSTAQPQPAMRLVAPPQNGFAAVRMTEPSAALGLMVQLSIQADAFASQRFGTWARVLIGQVNRGDYIVLLKNGRPVGFAGWFPASMEDAETWIEGNTDIPPAPRGQGDCAVMNAFMAPDATGSRYLREAFLSQIPNLKWVYAKRVKGDKRRMARVPNPRCTRPDQ